MSVKTPTKARRVSAAPAKPRKQAVPKSTAAAAKKAEATKKQSVGSAAVARPGAPKASGRTVPAKAQPAAAKKPPSKPKLVRDDFTMPKADFDLIDSLKRRAVALGRPAKKSELLRAGLQSLVALQDASFRERLAALAPLKPGASAKAR